MARPIIVPLYRITLTMETGEERIYTRFGKPASDKLAERLRWQWPRCIVAVELEDKEVRQPIVGECTGAYE